MINHDLEMSQDLLLQIDKITERVARKNVVNADVSSLSSCEISYPYKNESICDIRYI